MRWGTLAAGLGATAVELGWLGLADVSNALTYAGRVNGVLFLAAAVLEIAALVALLNLRQHGTGKVPSALVLVGVLVCLLANLVLFVLQLDGRRYTPYLWIWVLLLVWSLWALWCLHHIEVWSHIPHARGIAVGVVVTGVLAVANFTYTQIYQPYTSTAMLTSTIEFGKATKTDGAVSLPVRVRTRNPGKVGVYVLGSLYQVSGRKKSFVAAPRQAKAWLQDINSRQWDLMRYTDVHDEGYELLAQGPFIGRAGPVPVLEPGAELVTERVIQFPVSGAYELLSATANVAYLRKDRAKIIDNYTESGRSSWTRKYIYGSANVAPNWVAEPGINTFRFRSRITHSNALLEKTRPPHHVTLWWVLREPGAESQFGSDLRAVIGTKQVEKAEPTAAEVRRMRDRYGLANAPSGILQKTMAELLPPET